MSFCLLSHHRWLPQIKLIKNPLNWQTIDRSSLFAFQQNSSNADFLREKKIGFKILSASKIFWLESKANKKWLKINILMSFSIPIWRPLIHCNNILPSEVPLNTFLVSFQADLFLSLSPLRPSPFPPLITPMWIFFPFLRPDSSSRTASCWQFLKRDLLSTPQCPRWRRRRHRCRRR